MNFSVSVFDFEEKGKYKPMGNFDTTLNDFLNANTHDNIKEDSKRFIFEQKGKSVRIVYVCRVTIGDNKKHH